MEGVAQRAERLRAELRGIPLGAPIETVFEVVAGSVPLRAGFVDRFLQHASTLGLLCPYRLDAEVLEGIMRARETDTPLVLATVAAAPCGRLIRDQDVAQLIDWSNVAGHRALLDNGLAHPAAVKISVRPCGSDREHTYLALIQGADDPPLAKADAVVIRGAWRDIRAAVERVRVPLLASEPLLLQVAEERRLGLALCTSSGQVVQSNYLAHLHAGEFAAEGTTGATKGHTAGPEALARTALARGGTKGFCLQLAHPRQPKVLRVEGHHLAREVHELPEDMVLLVTQTFDVQRMSAENLIMRRLPPRLQETARYLVHTGMTYKQIARAMSVREGTVRKHVERLYRTLGVSSRAALGGLLRNEPSDRARGRRS